MLQEVAKELADEGRPVIWIFDSFSNIITSALEKAAIGSMASHRAIVSELFQLSSVLIPIPVCSSATTAGALRIGELFLTNNPTT